MTRMTFLGTALALAIATPALAQDNAEAAPNVANGQSIGAWTVNCVAIAVGQTSCSLIQRVLRSSDRAFVADIVASNQPEGQTLLSVRVPIGAHLPTPFSMRPSDAEEQTDFTWQACTSQLCEALLLLDAEETAALSSTTDPVIAGFRPTTSSEPFIFEFSLAGMTEGLAAIAPQ